MESQLRHQLGWENLSPQIDNFLHGILKSHHGILAMDSSRNYSIVSFLVSSMTRVTREQQLQKVSFDFYTFVFLRMRHSRSKPWKPTASSHGSMTLDCASNPQSHISIIIKRDTRAAFFLQVEQHVPPSRES